MSWPRRHGNQPQMLDECPLIVDGLWQEMVACGGGGGVLGACMGRLAGGLGLQSLCLAGHSCAQHSKTILVALDWLERTWNGFRSLHGVNL